MKNIVFKGLSTIRAKIQKLVVPEQGIVAGTSAEISGLKRELKMLEAQLHSLDNEKIELEKLISDFQYRHSFELGPILLEILRLRVILFQSDQTKYEEAKRDEKRYRKQVRIDIKEPKLQLNNKEKKELKKKFRKATLLCHPDKVNEELKDEAQGMFIKLKKAYDLNDLQQVSEILTYLQSGNYFKSNSDSVSEKELLLAEIKKLRIRVKTLKNRIISIKNSNAYKKIIAIDDWDVYFRNMKEKLETELEEIKKQIGL